MRHGEQVSAFERAFADYVNAKHAVAMTNGTVTLEVALLALGIQHGEKVATTALTMAATTIGILNAGGVPHHVDVNPDTWLMKAPRDWFGVSLPVSLYGLHAKPHYPRSIDDAAQTLRPHDAGFDFTSYSLQRSKIINTGEGGVLVTNDEGLATEAREIASLGYKLGASQSRIDSNTIKSPTYNRHYRIRSLNARMNDLTAAEGLKQLARAEYLLEERADCAAAYIEAIGQCAWMTRQRVPDGATHDYWTYAVACDTSDRANQLCALVVKYKGERFYPAWRLTFDEPAFRHLDPGPDACLIARSLQPRLVQMQCNDLASAERNATALRLAIQEIGA